MSDNAVLAIDFGTTNSYYTKCPSDQISPVGIDFGTGKDGLATAVLYRSEQEPVVGDAALEEFGELAGRIPADWRLRAQFKPDILSDDESARNAEDFLRLVVQQSQRRHIVLEPEKREVIFGVPSEMSAGYGQRLGEIAERAGYGRIRVVDEPKGAILYHLWHKDFSPRQARKGILVIDFGGGTCDFAYLSRLNVRASWGDLKLGGRLFDDLFFQWFCDQNPESVEKIRANGDVYYVLFYLCRKVKESFSRTMARDRKEKVTKRVSRYGAISEMTWEEFLERARTYKASESYVNFQNRLHSHHPEVRDISQVTDLLQWFRKSLSDGLKANEIEPAEISRVILAGGSSQWPFVTDVACNILGCDRDSIIRSDRPYTEISEGLAILPALQTKLNTTKKNLTVQMPDFCAKLEAEVLQPQIESFNDSVARQIVTELFDEKLKPLIEQFQREGGTLNQLENSIQAETHAFEPEIETIVQERLETFTNELSGYIVIELDRWFSQYGIVLGQDRISLESQPQKLNSADIALPEIYQNLRAGFSSVSGVIIAYITGSLAGGGGIALIAAEPVAAIAAGLVAGIGGYFAGDELAGWLRKRRIPGWLAKKILREKKIYKLRTKVYKKIQQLLQEPAEKLGKEARRCIADTVQANIEAISEIDKI